LTLTTSKLGFTGASAAGAALAVCVVAGWVASAVGWLAAVLAPVAAVVPVAVFGVAELATGGGVSSESDS
jgi:CHASE2 domain-containing sensor protein